MYDLREPGLREPVTSFAAPVFIHYSPKRPDPLLLFDRAPDATYNRTVVFLLKKQTEAVGKLANRLLRIKVTRGC